MAQTTYKGLEVQATGANAGTWGTVLNTQALEYIDLNLGGIITVALTNVNVTLSATESRSVLVRLTGTLTGNVVITTACMGFFVVTNATTGAFTVNFTNGTGTSAEAVQGFSTLIISDATNGCRLGNNPPASAYVDGSIATVDLADDAVTFAKIQNITTSRLLGRTTASSGNTEEIAVGSGMTFTALALDVAVPSPSRLISTTTVSAQASLPVTSGIDSTYDEYELHVAELRPSTNAVAISFQVSTDGGSTWKTSGYNSSVVLAISNGGTSATGAITTGVALTESAFTASSSTSYSWRGVIRFWPNGTATRKNIMVQGSYYSGTQFVSATSAGVWDGGNDAVTAFRLIASSGNISGTVRLIGVKNS